NHATGNGEEKSADDAVGKHLQDRTGNADRVRGRESKQNKTHVAHARIADDEFQIALAQSDGSGVNNSDDGENCDPWSPDSKAEWKKIYRHSESPVGAEFHHDSGKQHRAGGRRGDVTGRRPGVKRPNAGENREPEKQNGKR